MYVRRLKILVVGSALMVANANAEEFKDSRLSVKSADSMPQANVSVGGTFVLKSQVLAGGGKRVGNGVFDLTGTLAQSTAGPVPAAVGGIFELRGGFHKANTVVGDSFFQNGFEN